MIRCTACIAAVLVLAACGGQPKSGTASSAPPAPPSSSAPPPPAVPVKGQTPDRDFVIGKWGTDGDCTLAIDLRPDGTSDGPFGTWTYADGAITFAEAPDLTIEVTVIDGRTMASTNGEGKTSTMTRCP